MLLVAAALGCSSSSNSTVTNPVATGSASVTIADFSFSPQSVTIAVGGTVTWTNNGPSTHTATANAGEFDSGNIGNGGNFSHTFNTKGVFAYHCAIHPQMTGTVTVQ
jgi:plastocyanin